MPDANGLPQQLRDSDEFMARYVAAVTAHPSLLLNARLFDAMLGLAFTTGQVDGIRQCVTAAKEEGERARSR